MAERGPIDSDEPGMRHARSQGERQEAGLLFQGFRNRSGCFLALRFLGKCLKSSMFQRRFFCHLKNERRYRNS